MKKKNQTYFWMAGCLFLLFVVWTIAVQVVDVQAIGPLNTSVGFAALNGFFHQLTGEQRWLYTLTDWLSVIPLLVALGFGCLGLKQLIKRKRLFKVDWDLLLLGGFYGLVIAAYALFELFAVNYRPVLIQGSLEVSYPSSTTLLVLCVMPTAIMQFNKRIKNQKQRKMIRDSVLIFTALMVLGRTISGVHWLTDILGGALLSGSLTTLYSALNQKMEDK